MSTKNTNLRIEMKKRDSRGVTTPPLGHFAVSLIIDWLCEAFSPLFLLLSPTLSPSLFFCALWPFSGCPLTLMPNDVIAHFAVGFGFVFSSSILFSFFSLFCVFIHGFLLLKFEAFETCCLTASLCYLSKLIFLLLPHGAWLFRPIELSTLLNWVYYSNLIV